MGNTVRTFSSLGKDDPGDEADRTKLGDSLDDIGDQPKLGDALTGMFEDVDVDSVEAVRELRQDT